MAASSPSGGLAREPPEGVEPFSVVTRVRFEDIDGMKHANNARYLTYLEEARLYWARDVVGVEGMEDLGFILAHAAIDFLQAARVAQALCVQMWVPRIGGKSWDFAYRVVDQEAEGLCAAALTTQVAYDYRKDVTQQIPERLREALEPLAPDGAVGSSDETGRGFTPGGKK